MTVPRRVYIYIQENENVLNFKHLKRISSPSQGIFENPKSIVFTTLDASNLLMGSNRMCAGGEGPSLINHLKLLSANGLLGRSREQKKSSLPTFQKRNRIIGNPIFPENTPGN